MFGAGMLLCIGACLFLNARTSTMYCGQSLPSDIQTRQYLLEGFQKEPGPAYVFSFSAQASEPPLVLTITDASPFVLSWNGTKHYQYKAQDEYSRSLSIPLGSPNKGVNIIRVHMSVWGSGDGELLLGSSSVPKLLLGSAISASEASSYYRQVVTLSSGLYLMMIFSSLSLYLRRKQERYLLALIFVALASMTVMLIDSYAPIFHISQSQYASIRSPLFICPAVFTAAIGFYLFYDQLPDTVRPFLTVKNLLLATGIIMVFQYFLRYNLNFLLRIALMIPLLSLFSYSAKSQRPGALLLAAGCGIADGARLVVYLVNTLNVMPAGEMLIYLRITQLGYLAYLMLCMVVIFGRFADKFTEAETLVGTLDAKVYERTAQLQDAYRRLEQAQTREHEMMTNVLHDLRTPIFHIQGCLDMLKPKDASEQDVVNLMKERTEYLKNLAQNLFLAAKLEENSIAFHRHEINLSALCHFLVDNTRISAQAKGIALVKEIAAVQPVFSDGFRIRQVLENLLDNAVKYTPEGGRIVLTLREELDHISICISNTGQGISPNDLPRVFDRFYHGPTYGSSGLGLYIAKTLLECLNGTIEAYSADGITRFTVHIARGQKEVDMEV